MTEDLSETEDVVTLGDHLEVRLLTQHHVPIPVHRTAKQ